MSELMSVGEPVGLGSDGVRETRILHELERKSSELQGNADQVAVAWLLHHPAPIVSLNSFAWLTPV